MTTENEAKAADLRALLEQIDDEQIEATAAERAYIAGALHALEQQGMNTPED